MPDTIQLDYRKFNYATLTEERDESILKPFSDRASAAKFKRKPLTPQERLEGFKILGFRPHGVYFPTDDDLRIDIFDKLRDVGDIEDEDLRRQKYFELQQFCEQLEREGVPGKWGGQQGPTRSTASYRLLACGRRWGKTYYAAHEGICYGIMRPGSLIWSVAPSMRQVKRCFDMLVKIIEERKIPYRFMRNTDSEKYIKLDNGTEFEGIPVGENIYAAAGAAVDFAIVDEAAQLVEEAWDRGISPTLADKQGQALLLSSYEGEGDFFETKCSQAKADRAAALAAGEDVTNLIWEAWESASWDNFAAFPQGRSSPAIVRAEKDTQPIDFLEQYGALPAGSKERVYPEYKELVHWGDYPFDPDWPVSLAADPSGGANPYGILAIQDYGHEIHIIDEFYELHMSPEDYGPILRRREWWDNVEDMIIDSAAGDIEVARWEKQGVTCYPVEKPLITERLPLVKNLLRDPGLFDELKYNKIKIACKEAGIDPLLYDSMEPRAQRPILLRVEELLAPNNLTAQDIMMLSQCAWLKVDVHCTFTNDEFKSYTYPKRRQQNTNYRENPKDYKNHLMDALGYWVWEKKRFDIYDRAIEAAPSYIQPVQTKGWSSALTFEDNSYIPPTNKGWLDSMRSHYGARGDQIVSYLQQV